MAKMSDIIIFKVHCPFDIIKLHVLSTDQGQLQLKHNFKFYWSGLIGLSFTSYSCKPSFFHDNSANLFEVDPESGMLLNTDNGTPVPQVNQT